MVYKHEIDAARAVRDALDGSDVRLDDIHWEIARAVLASLERPACWQCGDVITCDRFGKWSHTHGSPENGHRAALTRPICAYYGDVIA